MYNKKTSFADFIVKEVCPENKFLEEMNKVIPWHEIENWFNKKVVKKNIKVGRPSYPVIMMFKIHLIQQWYNLSDRETEFQISDRLSFRKFLGIGIEDNVQDATFLRSKGKPHKDEEKNIDIDAQFGHKGYGYSGTINMDEKTKLIRKTTVTSAEILDFQSTEDVLIGDEIKVYADKGYAPARKILQIKYPKTRFHIMCKRNRGKKGEPTPALDENKQLRNISYAKIRARVEHAFSKIKFVFKFQRLRYVGLDRVTAKFNSLCIAYNFSRLGFLMRKQGITV